MSTRGHDTGDAQWFINLKDNLRLNRDYTVFAEVIEGIDVVDGVFEGDVMASVRPVRAWRDPFPHRARFLGSPGNRIHYLDWGGRGPAVVLLPGFSLTAHAYDEIATELSTQFRVIAVTPLGVGESDAPENRAYTIQSMADDLKMVLDSLRISRASLVGHSISGSVAAAFAIKHPRRVSRIVFLDAFPYFFAERGDSIHGRNTVPPPAMVGDTTYEDIARYLGQYWFRPWTRALEADLRAKSLGPDNTRREALTSQYIESNRRQPPDVRALPVPSLQLCAIPSVSSEFAWLRPDSARYETALRFVSEDLRPFARRLCSRFARTVPRGRVREIAGSHYLFFTRPAETARYIRSFLEPAR